MKNRVFLIVGIALAVLLSFPTITQAQKIKKKKQLKREIRQYVKTNVVPEMKPHRDAFDSNLSAQEKATIVETRTKLRELRTNHKGKKDKAYKAKRKQIKEPVQKIGKAHEAEFKKMKEELKSKREKWRADIKAIVNKYVKDQAKKKKKIKNALRRYHKRTRFLLWDTKKGEEEQED